MIAKQLEIAWHDRQTITIHFWVKELRFSGTLRLVDDDIIPSPLEEILVQRNRIFPISDYDYA